MNCDCLLSGFCERYQRTMPPALHRTCQSDTPDAEKLRQRWLSQRDSVPAAFVNRDFVPPPAGINMIMQAVHFGKPVTKCPHLWKRVRAKGVVQKRQLETTCCGPKQMDLFHCRCPSQPMGAEVTLLDCARCPVMQAEKKEVFISFFHGLGDAVAFTAVLAHLAKHRPGWAIDMFCQDYQRPLFSAKVRHLVPSDEIDRKKYDAGWSIEWSEGQGLHPNWAPTKAARCLTEVFGITPEPELLRYTFEPSQEAKQEAEIALRQINKTCVMIHYQGDQCRDSKDLPLEAVDALCGFLKNSGYHPIVIEEQPTVTSASRFYDNIDIMAAYMGRMALNIMIDSGPGKLALTTGARLLTVWRKSNPMHNVDMPDGDHLVPVNWADYLEYSHGVDRNLNKAAAMEYFAKTYRRSEYTDLTEGLLAATAKILGIDSPRIPLSAPRPAPLPIRADCPRKLTLATGICPGDVMTMTAAVEMLHQQHPGRYKTAVDVPCMAIWENNPWIVPAEPDFERVQMEYHTIHESGNRPIAFLSGYTEFLADALKIPLKLTTNRPHLYLSSAEKEWMNQVWEATGSSAPYWLIVNGIKADYGAKAYPFMQEVVDLLAGKVRFAQIGKTTDNHRLLRGVVNLLDKTSDRALIRLAYHAQGVVSTVTWLMHLAAAFEKPAVIVAGGREPRQWNQYPTNTVLSTVGALDCCRQGACWRSRVVAQHDGKDGQLCSRPMPTEFPAGECMTRISSELVAKTVEMYL